MQLSLKRRGNQDELSVNEPDASHSEKAPNTQNSEAVPLKERIRHFTWAWFNFPLGTGGIALLLAETPHRFNGLDTIGKIVYIFDLFMFVLLCIGITTRFVMDPSAFLGGMQAYGVPNVGPWLPVVCRVIFWWYIACTFLLAVGMYLHLFTAPPERLTIQSMTPGWLLPIFPIMVSGTMASSILPTQPDVQRLAIVTAGVTMQGLGWMVAFLTFSFYLHRLLQYGLPAPNLRPGMFMAVGPPSFTGLALIGISKGIPENYDYFAVHPNAITILQNMGLFTGIFLWALGKLLLGWTSLMSEMTCGLMPTTAFWFFCIALLAVLSRANEMSFYLVWWAFIFPNVGFTIATIQIGHGLSGSQGILWVASIMTILLVAMWLFVMVMNVRAVWKRQIMMPGMDEDKDAYKDDDLKHGIHVPP
ncbi:hypothetical protein K431DRAFT_291380 [Polychaeton citri CBS 116435]|uniref:C4-dicarboxylate transporter/malic acid transport protein n=1 Tax=Polychaeton citri CBS 116435 TaxID=1314669 RepID=A0A9P4QH09_9PEZI|nr:hypothetical protein K431DRAFT_291380 [Polychaeton citri CBS 116435]